MLLSLLQTGREWPGSVLAARLEVGGRTLRRDIERLRELGYSIPATRGPEGGYRLSAGTELPPLLFDEEQTVAVALSLQTAPGIGADIGEAAVRALATIRQVMPSRLRHRLDAIHVRTVPGPDASIPEVALEVLVTIANAIRDHETLRFDYAPHTGADADARPRRVEPHHLISSHGRWYLLGWDADREDWRLFRADRVIPRVPNGPRFTPRPVPGGDVDAFVAARFKGSDVDEWSCRGSVLVELPARDVLPFVGDGTVTAVDGASCTVERGSWSWESLAAWFGMLGAPLHVVGPPELARAFAVLAERYAQAVGSSRSPGDDGHR